MIPYAMWHHMAPYGALFGAPFLIASFLLQTCAHYTLLPDTRTANLFSPLQESPEPLEVERSTGMFDTDSELFRKNLMMLTVLLCCALLGGIVWEVLHRLRQKMKIQPQGKSSSQQFYNSILYYAV